MHLLLSLFFWLPSAWPAPKIMYAPRITAVRQGPGDGYVQLFVLSRGEKIAVVEQEGDYSKIRVMRGGKVISGFVLSADLKRKVKEDPFEAEGMAIGLGPIYSQLDQKGKAFQAEDEVRYTTSGYVSKTVSPYIFLQSRRVDFWRFFFGYRITRYKGSARTDIPGAAPRSVHLEHTLLALGAQRAWTPLRFFRPFYFGLGAEVARGTKLRLTLDGTELPTQEEDLPFYFGVHGFSGLQFMLGKTWSVSAELRAGSYLNQSVPIYSLEYGGTLFYWF